MNAPVTQTGNINKDYINCDLDELDLSWEESELPQNVRTKHVHKLHSYMGKFIPQLVEIFLRRYFESGDTILDPFGGSGTTLVEALSNNMNTIGVDISPLNCLIMKVKTKKYNIKKLEREILEVYNKTENFFNNKQKLFDKDNIEIKEEDLKTDNDYINTWYTERAKKELLLFRALITDYECKDALKLILSRSARSARNIRHYELDNPKNPVDGPYECKKHGRTCYPVSEALKFLKRYSFDMIDRIKEFDKIRSNRSVDIINKDVRSFKLKTPADGVITSPPYVGNINYHEQHRYSYELLDLNRNDEQEIGPKFKGKSKSARQDYLDGMISAMENISSNVKSKGKIIIVANDNYDMYQEIFEQSNLKLINTIQRDVNRRTGRRSSGYSESIFITENK